MMSALDSLTFHQPELFRRVATGAESALLRSFA
jgi:hypothetical protein